MISLAPARNVIGLVVTACAAVASTSAAQAQEISTQTRTTASAPQTEKQAPFKQPTMPIRDVALSEDGVVQGRVIDNQGKAVDGAIVVISRDDELLHKMVTNKEGQFAAKGLRPGVYTIATAQGGGLYRLWPTNIAPPAAAQRALVTANQPVLRGQFGNGALSQWTTTLVAGGGLAVGIIALDKLDDLEDDVNDLKSP